MTKLAVTLCSIALAALASGCTSMESPDKADSSDKQEDILLCDVQNLQSFVGQKLTPEITQQILSESNASIIRVLKPNQAVTMEFNPARVNIHLDIHDVIGMITCG